MINPHSLCYSKIHPETIRAQWRERGCWVVATRGLCDSGVGYPPGFLVCAPATETDPAKECIAPLSTDKRWDRPWFWDMPERSRYFLSLEEMAEDRDWFWRADYGRRSPEVPEIIEPDGIGRVHFGERPAADAPKPERSDCTAGVASADVDGERRVTAATGGAKGTKPCQLGWVPPFVMEELGRLYGLGGEKYGDPLNYIKGYDWSLSYNALLRHFWAWMGGETHDPKDGQHHLASVIWHAIALQYFERHKPEFDDRLASRSGTASTDIEEDTPDVGEDIGFGPGVDLRITPEASVEALRAAAALLWQRAREARDAA